MASPENQENAFPEELSFTVEQITKGKQALVGRLSAPVWTASKAKIIKAYLDLFVKVTFRGTYIDAFAGHQYQEHQNYWSAKLVWEGNPGTLRKRIHRCEFFEQNPTSFKNLKAMVDSHPADGRAIQLHRGDCNSLVSKMLVERPITGPAFCLLDQRTTECSWNLVRNLASHKTEGTKIELFYFLMAKWKDRSLKNRGPKRDRELSEWWGKDDYDTLFNASHTVIQEKFVERFQQELGYTFVRSYPIADRSATVPGGGIHYYMIHASDHPEAPRLMVRAYNKVAGGYDPNSSQPNLDWSPSDVASINSLYRRKGEIKNRTIKPDRGLA